MDDIVHKKQGPVLVGEHRFQNYWLKRAQNVFPLRRLKRFGMGTQILKRFYSCTIESILVASLPPTARHYRG